MICVVSRGGVINELFFFRCLLLQPRSSVRTVQTSRTSLTSQESSVSRSRVTVIKIRQEMHQRPLELHHQTASVFSLLLLVIYFYLLFFFSFIILGNSIRLFFIN